MRSFDYWRELAGAAVNGSVSTAEDQAKLAALRDKVAAKCCELERNGKKASIWHAASLVCGTPCHCYDCDPPTR